ncbi:hypothetical protein, partial [Candidatus Parabeggiatoa sp. HSG14]|uniref:hypothetical protein n=1 Tax=Candidatus Parabeggiatoa sp. HSG14 TaxID=3055593 RepID=UPI0025A69044|nr:hypothetical protein [Thiotrichales bacterium HSG14]
FALELKRRSKTVLTEGKKQLAGYLKRLSLPNGWLIIFHRGKVSNWDAVGKREQVTFDGKQIEVIWL